MKMRRSEKAQSMLEYAIVITAVIGIILYAAANWLKPDVQKSMENAGTAMGDAAEKF
jgi:hypothetical protein